MQQNDLSEISIEHSTFVIKCDSMSIKLSIYQSTYNQAICSLYRQLWFFQIHQIALFNQACIIRIESNAPDNMDE